MDKIQKRIQNINEEIESAKISKKVSQENIAALKKDLKKLGVTDDNIDESIEKLEKEIKHLEKSLERKIDNAEKIIEQNK